MDVGGFRGWGEGVGVWVAVGMEVGCRNMKGT